MNELSATASQYAAFLNNKGRVISDIILSMVSTDDYLDSYMGALAVDDTDGNLNNCTPHMCVLNPIFAKRGLTKYDPRCKPESEAAQVCEEGIDL